MALTDKLTAIADAIRSKTGTSESLTLDAMVTAIDGISVGGGDEASVLNSILDRSITEFSSNITELGAYTFSHCMKLTTVNTPNLDTIGENAFLQCTRLTNLELPKLKTIGNYAFSRCTRLTNLEFPNVETVGSGAFQGQSTTTYNMELTTVKLPKAITLGSSAFNDCGVSEVIAPLVTSIGNNCFAGSSSSGYAKIINADFPLITKIESTTFSRCSKLVNVNTPLVHTIDSRAFQYCTSLVEINLPVLSTLKSTEQFYGCTSLKSVDFPLLTSLGASSSSGDGSSCFYGCTSLEKARFDSVTDIGYRVFYNCSALKSLILSGETVCNLLRTDALTNSAIANGTGYIYVPSALIDSYKAATNWSTYAAQFRALEDYTVDGTITGELDETKI